MRGRLHDHRMLVALSLLVMVIIPLSAVFMAGLRTSVITKTQMNARQVASAEMDRVRSLNFGCNWNYRCNGQTCDL